METRNSAPKTEPAPGDFRPRTPHDPEGFDPVDYDWDRGNLPCPPNCSSCPFWSAGAPDPRRRCPRMPQDGRPNLDRMSCLGRNRPNGECVKYFRKKTYGNEEEA